MKSELCEMCDTGMVLVSTIATVMFLFTIYFLLFSPDLYCNDKEWGGTDTLVYNLVCTVTSKHILSISLSSSSRRSETASGVKLWPSPGRHRHTEDKSDLAKCNSTPLNKCGRLREGLKKKHAFLSTFCK